MTGQEKCDILIQMTA